MSQSRVERIRAILPPDGTDLVGVFGVEGAVGAGDLVRADATVRFVAPSAETSDTGPKAFTAIWADWLEPWKSFRLYHDEVFERGDRVIVLSRLQGVTKRDGVEMEQEAAAVFHFEGDQVVEIEFNLDREDALKD